MGVLLAFLSAIFFGLNNATSRRGVVTATAGQAIFVTVPVNALMFFVAALFTHQLTAWTQLSSGTTALLAGAGVINYIIARYCNYRGIKVIGAVRSAPIFQLGMVVAVAAGVWLLGESISMGQIVSIALILVGSFLVLPRRGADPEKSDRHHQTEGYVFALLGSLGYGIGPVFIRIACGGTALGMIGGLIAFSGAMVVLGALLALMPSQRQALRELDAAGAKWLVLTGIINGGAQITLFMALSLAPVSLVIPIQRTSVAFRVAFSFLINREFETFEGSILLGTAISLLGAVTLTRS